jgi:hypothetical protein
MIVNENISQKQVLELKRELEQYCDLEHPLELFSKLVDIVKAGIRCGAISGEVTDLELLPVRELYRLSRNLVSAIFSD